MEMGQLPVGITEGSRNCCWAELMAAGCDVWAASRWVGTKRGRMLRVRLKAKMGAELRKRLWNLVDIWNTLDPPPGGTFLYIGGTFRRKSKC
jgi:hypothetical protein